MSEFQVLHGEPRHKVNDFVDEVLGRWQQVETDLHTELVQLIQRLADSMLKLKEGNKAVTGRIERIAWLENGKLMIRLATDGLRYAAERENHQLDRYVNKALEAWPTATKEIRQEIADLLRGFVTQLGVIAKHNPSVRLRRIAFGAPQAWGDDVLFVQLLHEDRPFGPLEARWT